MFMYTKQETMNLKTLLGVFKTKMLNFLTFASDLHFTIFGGFEWFWRTKSMDFPILLPFLNNCNFFFQKSVVDKKYTIKKPLS